MNNEAEAIHQFVVWLLQTLDSVNSTEKSTKKSTASGTEKSTVSSTENRTPSGDWNQATSPERIESGMQIFAEPLSSAEAVGFINEDLEGQQKQSIANPQKLSLPLEAELPPLTLGDVPAVHNRFHGLLKQRLKMEIERNPPRFPWETEQQDYQDDYQFDPQYDYQHGYEACPEPFFNEAQLLCRTAKQPAVIQSVDSSAPFWTAHLKTINLPIPLPNSVLQTLFERCRHLMQSSLREGRQLVEAVEFLFPGEKAALEGIAGLVLTSPVRSGHRSSLRSNPNFPTSYEQASRPQQMVLSLLAARQLFEAMTLLLSSSGETVSRSWLTEMGPVTLKAQYFPDANRAQVKVQLPLGGTVQFQQNVPEQTALESIASCTQAGELRVSLSPMQPEQTASLTIELAGSDVPLVFTVRLPSDF